MPDISMCSSKECPKREQCYRAKAKPSGDRQSWINFFLPGVECENFMEIWK